VYHGYSGKLRSTAGNSDQETACDPQLCSAFGCGPAASTFKEESMSDVPAGLPKPWTRMMNSVVNWSRIHSPWAIHFNSGSCNGCDIEILATLTPRFDVERFGIKLQGSPRHADVLICTGPVTLQSRDRLRRIYDQMPEPKFVVAVGSCAASGGVFQGCYNVMGGVEQVIPVNAFVPGCPPRPEAIIDGIAKLLDSLKETKKDTKAEVAK
jgi:NADH-quinone oxidoreductase B subunit